MLRPFLFTYDFETTHVAQKTELIGVHEPNECIEGARVREFPFEFLLWHSSMQYESIPILSNHFALLPEWFRKKCRVDVLRIGFFGLLVLTKRHTLIDRMSHRAD